MAPTIFLLVAGRRWEGRAWFRVGPEREDFNMGVFLDPGSGPGRCWERAAARGRRGRLTEEGGGRGKGQVGLMGEAEPEGSS